MGVGVSRGNAVNSSAVKIVHAGPKVEYIYHPISAKEVMQRYPKHHVTTPQVFRSVIVSEAVLSPEVMLLPGEKFYLLPSHTLHRLMRRQENAKVGRVKDSKRRCERVREVARRLSEEASYEEACDPIQHSTKARRATLAEHLLASPATHTSQHKDKMKPEQPQISSSSHPNFDKALENKTKKDCNASTSVLHRARSVASTEILGYEISSESLRISIADSSAVHAKQCLQSADASAARPCVAENGMVNTAFLINPMPYSYDKRSRRLLCKIKRCRTSWTPNLHTLPEGSPE